MRANEIQLNLKHKLVIVWTYFVFGLSALDILISKIFILDSMPEELSSYNMLEYHRFVALALVNFFQSITILYLFYC